MKLNQRVAIITEENISKLSRLYGEIDIDDLSRIVNNHLKVAIDEIEEDLCKDNDLYKYNLCSVVREQINETYECGNEWIKKIIPQICEKCKKEKLNQERN